MRTLADAFPAGTIRPEWLGVQAVGGRDSGAAVAIDVLESHYCGVDVFCDVHRARGTAVIENDVGEVIGRRLGNCRLARDDSQSHAREDMNFRHWQPRWINRHEHSALHRFQVSYGDQYWSGNWGSASLGNRILGN